VVRGFGRTLLVRCIQVGMLTIASRTNSVASTAQAAFIGSTFSLVVGEAPPQVIGPCLCVRIQLLLLQCIFHGRGELERIGSLAFS
jgi:hypothetical protein